MRARPETVLSSQVRPLSQKNFKNKLTSLGPSRWKRGSLLCSNDSLARRLGQSVPVRKGGDELSQPSIVSQSARRFERMCSHKVDVVDSSFFHDRSDERMSDSEESPYEEDSRGKEEGGGSEEFEMKVPGEGREGRRRRRAKVSF